MQDCISKAFILIALVCAIIVLFFCIFFSVPSYALDVSAHMEIVEIKNGNVIHVVDQDGEEYIYYHDRAEEYFYVGQQALVIMHFLKINEKYNDQRFELNYIMIPPMFDRHVIESHR